VFISDPLLTVHVIQRMRSAKNRLIMGILKYKLPLTLIVAR